VSAADTAVILSGNIAQIDAPSGRRYNATQHKGGHFVMTPQDAAAVVKLGGALASLAGAAKRSAGYRCGTCGFGAFLRTCSRCGGGCERE
jgi:hypothetical protein